MENEELKKAETGEPKEKTGQEHLAPFDNLVAGLDTVRRILDNLANLARTPNEQGVPVVEPVTIDAICGGANNLLGKLTTRALESRNMSMETVDALMKTLTETQELANQRHLVLRVIRSIVSGKVRSSQFNECVGTDYEGLVGQMRTDRKKMNELYRDRREAHNALEAMYEAVVSGEVKTKYDGFEDRVETAIELFRRVEQQDRLIALIEAESTKYKKNRRGISELRKVLAAGGDAVPAENS